MPATDDNLSQVFRLLGEYAGVEPESLGIGNVTHTVRRQMVAGGMASPQEFCHRLLSDASAMEQLLEELLVPETWFFRDSSGFRCLADRLADRPWSRSGVVRVLSIACSTGEEVYSLAMALRKMGLEPPQYSLLGVDLSRRALETARLGKYSARSFREPGESESALCERWFERSGDVWQVCDALRCGVEFRWANLSRPDFLANEPGFDVIFCRNVLIYLHAEARLTTIGHVRRLLSPNGLVWSAPAEARIFTDAGFQSLGSECPFAFGSPMRDDVSSRDATDARRRRTAAGSPNGSALKTTGLASPRADALQPLKFSPRRHAAEPCVLAPAEDVVTTRLVPRQAAIRAAREAADQGRLEEADAICDRILAEDPACVEAHYLRGVIQQVQGMLHEAQRSLEKALYLDPHHYNSLTHMMLLAEHRGDLSAAANFRRRMEEIAAKGIK